MGEWGDGGDGGGECCYLTAGGGMRDQWGGRIDRGGGTSEAGDEAARSWIGRDLGEGCRGVGKKGKGLKVLTWNDSRRGLYG